MPIPKYFEMHKPFLNYLKDGDVHKLKELREFMIKTFALTTEEIAEMLPSGRQTIFANRWLGEHLFKKGRTDCQPCKSDICDYGFRKASAE